MSAKFASILELSQFSLIQTGISALRTAWKPRFEPKQRTTWSVAQPVKQLTPFPSAACCAHVSAPAALSPSGSADSSGRSTWRQENSLQKDI